MLLAHLVTAALSALPQEPPPPLLVLAGGEVLGSADYRKWLAEVDGGARIEEFVYDRLLERAVAAVPADAIPDDLRPRLAPTDDFILERLSRTAGEDAPRDFARQLAASGRTVAEALQSERVSIQRDARTALLVRRARVATDADLRRVFEDRYGPDGVRTEAWQRLVSFAEIRDGLTADHAGPPPGDDAVRKPCREGAEQIAARARELGGLEALGPIPLPFAFAGFAGPALEAAMRDLPVGAISAPIESRFGFHVIEIRARETTRYADVVDAVRTAWRNAPPSLEEQRALRERLFEQHGVQAALAARARR